MKRRVLVIDDSSFIRSSIVNTLETAGAEIIGSVGTGEEALELIEQLKPEIITLDMMLPDMTGLDILKVVKSHYPTVKVIMLSTIAQQSVIDEAKSLGVDQYLIKPISDEDLIQAFKEDFLR